MIKRAFKLIFQYIKPKGEAYDQRALNKLVLSAVGADTRPGRTLSTPWTSRFIVPPLWQAPFTPETCHIAEIILELPLLAFDIDTVVRCGAQSGFARIRSWHLSITHTNRPDSQRGAVTSHSHHNRKTPQLISSCVNDLLSSIL